MASPPGLFDDGFEKMAIFDPEVNNKGLFDPDFATTSASGPTAAQELPAFLQELSGQMVGIIWQ